MTPPVYLLLPVLSLVSAQTFQWGPCPNPSVQSNFSMQQYLGVWYEIEKLPTSYEKGKCMTVNFGTTSFGSLRVLFSETVDNKVETLDLGADQDPEEPAKIGIVFHSMLPKRPWWVLSTDYTTVSVVYSCCDFLQMFHLDFAWITSRKQSLSPQVVEEAKEVFRRNGIDISSTAWLVSDQTGCGDE